MVVMLFKSFRFFNLEHNQDVNLSSKMILLKYFSLLSEFSESHLLHQNTIILLMNNFTLPSYHENHDITLTAVAKGIHKTSQILEQMCSNVNQHWVVL